MITTMQKTSKVINSRFVITFLPFPIHTFHHLQKRTNRIDLQIQIFLVLKPCIMDAGTNKEIGHPPDKTDGHPPLFLQQWRTFPVADIHTFE